MLPTLLPVSAILEKRPATSRWASEYWRAIGIIVGERTEAPMTLMQQQGEISQYLYSGLQIALYKDECESYYHNMCAPKPACYIIADIEKAPHPTPFHVTLSFDEASSYLQGSVAAYPVTIPPELYQWMERFVIDNYFPAKKHKRQLMDWKPSLTKGKSHE